MPDQPAHHSPTDAVPRGTDELAADHHPREGRRWPHILIFGTILLLGAVQVWVWWFFDPILGRSIQNLIQYSSTLLAFVLLVVWFLFYAPLAKSIRMAALALLLVPAIGWAASVRSLEWTGDMQLVVRYRWEQTDAERLAEHRQAAGVASGSAVVATAAVVAQPEDMPTYRGANCEGIVVGPPLSQDWEASPPKVEWRQPCGGGYAQLVVVEPYMVTLEQRDAQEAVVCYDSATGQERWVYDYPAQFTEAMGGPGPRATPTIHDGFVYALGAQGRLARLNLVSGEVLWEKELLADRKIPNQEWGLCSAPLVVGDLVVVNPGGPKGDGLEAYRIDSGEIAWSREGVARHNDKDDDHNRPGYSSPMLATIHGVRQIVIYDGTGLRGYVPETGERLWEIEHRNGAGVNVAQPLVFDDGRIFVSCSYSVGCAMFQVEFTGGVWSVKEVWANRNLRAKFSSAAVVDGYIYGFDEGIFTCLDPATGDRKWKGGRYGHGQLLLTNGQILVHTEQGRAVLIQPNPDRLEEITSFATLDDPKNWNPPALVRGRLYVRNHREMACFRLTQ
jgi:outer membrane protein assembly factor BamB